MGLLTNSARKSFTQNRTYVPAWMSLAQWGALGLIPIIVLVSYFFGPSLDELPPPSATVAVQEDIILSQPSSIEEITTTVTGSPDVLVEFLTVDNETVTIPEQALNVSNLAANAFWRNEWYGIPVNGPTPILPETYSNAVITDGKIYTQTNDTLIFLYKVDLENDGVEDQSFQIKVVKSPRGWEYSS